MSKLRVLVPLAIAVAALAATVAGGASASHKASYQITIGVPGIPPVFLAVRPYIAYDNGYYEKYLGNATAIQIQDFTTGTAALTAVLNGQIDMAWAPTPTVIAAIANGAPVVGIEGMPVNDWRIGSMDSSISSCAALKGQTIGVDTVGGARYNALIGMLSTCGLTINDVKTVNFPGAAGMNAQIAGSLTLNVDHVDEVAQIEATTGKKVTIITTLAKADPYQHYDMLVVTKSNLAAHRAQYVQVLEGDIAASNYMYNPKNLTAMAKTAEITGDSKEVAAAALQHFLGIQWWNVNNSGLTQQRLTRTIGFNLKIGVIPASGNSLTWKSVSDTTLWKDAWKAVGKSLAVPKSELSHYAKLA